MSAIPRRIIEVSVKLANDSQTNQPNTFSGTGGSDTITLRGSRTSVRIQNSGSPSGSSGRVDVWGMTPSLMNQLATLGLVFNIVPKNTLTISVGVEGQGLALVFGGTIISGYGDYDAAPDVPFHFECNSGVAEAVLPASPSSFTGSTDVATIMSGIARLMNLGFENNGITAKLSNPYFSGNLKTQMQTCAEHAGINAEIINGSVLAIWPKGGSRSTPNPALVAPPPDGQMIGYPAYTQQGIIVRNVFDPRIAYGGTIKVKSSLKPVNDVGVWAINKMDLALDSLMPKGQWMQTIHAFNPKYPRPIPTQAGNG